MDQTKPLNRTFPLANMKQFQYLHAVQHQETQLFIDLKTEKHERLKLHATLRQLESELAPLHRQVSEPLPFSLAVPFIVDPPSSTASQDKRAQEHGPVPKPMRKNTLKGASNTTSIPQLREQSQAPPQTQPTPGPSSQDLASRIKQLEEKFKRKGTVVKQSCLPSDPNLRFYNLYDKF